jgi:hypothetical protein
VICHEFLNLPRVAWVFGTKNRIGRTSQNVLAAQPAPPADQK